MPFDSTRCILCLGLLMLVQSVAGQGLNDTGSLDCYSDTARVGTVTPTTPTPEPPGFEGQDCTRGAAAADAMGLMVKVGASSIPGRDFTKIANDGRELPASAALGFGPADWACTRDNITGLIWEIKVADPNHLRPAGAGYVWYDPDPVVNVGEPGGDTLQQCGPNPPERCLTTAFRDAVNALTGSERLCGATDWRMPSIRELQSLLSLSNAQGVDPEWFPNLRGSLWSGETYVRLPRYARFMFVASGGSGGLTTEGSLKSGVRDVVLVRSAP